MASGKVHNQFTNLAAATSLVGLQWFPLTTIIPFTIGCLLGNIFTPDNDQDAGTRANYHVRKLVKFDLLALWITPYAISYKHRSFITHFPVISTIWRVLYLYVPFIVFVYKNQQNRNFRLLVACLAALPFTVLLWLLTWYFWYYILAYGIYVLLGLMLSDTLHWLVDLF